MTNLTIDQRIDQLAEELEDIQGWLPDVTPEIEKALYTDATPAETMYYDEYLEVLDAVYQAENDLSLLWQAAQVAPEPEKFLDAVDQKKDDLRVLQSQELATRYSFVKHLQEKVETYTDLREAKMIEIDRRINDERNYFVGAVYFLPGLATMAILEGWWWKLIGAGLIGVGVWEYVINFRRIRRYEKEKVKWTEVCNRLQSELAQVIQDVFLPPPPK